MYQEVRIFFNDGTTTLDWYSAEDWNDSFQGFLADVAETCGMSASDVTGSEFTGNTDEPIRQI